MSSKDKNLSNVSNTSILDVETVKVGIAVAEWNEEITNSLWKACEAHLLENGILKANLHVVQVPGTFELPVACKMLLQQYGLDGTIAIGCVIKGETSHNEYINHAVANGLTQLSILSGKPCVFGVLTPNDKQQALDRAGGKYGNKGVEAASTLLKMIGIKKGFKDINSRIGF